MFNRPRPATICARCLARRYLSTSFPSQSVTTLPPPPPPSGAAKLTNRRLLALSGHDVTHFLQGIVTQNIRPGLTSGLYSAFLNAQGRVLHDVFIYPTTHSQLSQGCSSSSESTPASSPTPPNDPSYLIEVDATEASRLLSHIKKYKLRAKLTARLLEEGEWDVWSVWDAEKWTAHSSLPLPDSASTTTTTTTTTTIPNANANANPPASIGCIDPRAPGLGRRLVLPSSQTPLSSPPPTPSSPAASAADSPHQSANLTTLESYTLRRILHGVPEGQSEIAHATALPLECNMDYMGGVDFRKGCYVGQELTIRTRHTGVVRKRILPVRLYTVGEEVGGGGLVYDERWKGVVPGSGANIVRVGAEGKAAGRSAGRWVAGVGNVGLALCRLEVMVGEGVVGEFKVAGEEGEDGGGEVRVKAFVPSWHLNRGGVVDVLHRQRNT